LSRWRTESADLLCETLGELEALLEPVDVRVPLPLGDRDGKRVIEWLAELARLGLADNVEVGVLVREAVSLEL